MSQRKEKTKMGVVRMIAIVWIAALTVSSVSLRASDDRGGRHKQAAETRHDREPGAGRSALSEGGSSQTPHDGGSETPPWGDSGK